MSFLTRQSQYQELCRSFIAGDMGAEEFRPQFFRLWRIDHRSQIEAMKAGIAPDAAECALCAVLEGVLTMCAAYSLSARVWTAVTEAQFRLEVKSKSVRQWPEHAQAPESMRLVQRPRA